MENHHFIAGKIHYFYGNLFTGGYLDRKYEVNINQWNILVAHFSASLWGCPLWTKREKPVDRCPVISFFRVVNSTIFGKPHMVGDLPIYIYIYWNHQLQSKVLEYENTSIYIYMHIHVHIYNHTIVGSLRMHVLLIWISLDGHCVWHWKLPPVPNVES